MAAEGNDKLTVQINANQRLPLTLKFLTSLTFLFNYQKEYNNHRKMLNFGPYQRQFCSEMNRSVQCVDCAVNAKTRLEVYNSNSVPILLTH